MRTAFICRQCLSRLRQPTTRPSRFFSQAAQPAPPDAACESEWSEWSPPEENAGRKWPEDNPRDTLRKVHGPSFRKVHPGNPTVYAADLDIVQLRRKILNSFINKSSRKWFDLLQPHLMAFYNMTYPEGLRAMRQLKYILRGMEERGCCEDGELAEFLQWKYHTCLESPMTLSPAKTELKDAFRRVGSLSSIRNAWLQLPQTDRQKSWPTISWSILHSKPSLFLPFMESTYEPDLSPAYVVEDLLSSFLLRGRPIRLGEQEAFSNLVFVLLRDSPAGGLSIPEHVLAVVVSWTHVDKAVELLRLLSAHLHRLTQNTVLHFAKRFAEMREYKTLAADIMCYLARNERFDMNSPAAASICTTLLGWERDVEPQENDIAPDELFRKLHDSGFRPNLLTMTSLMRNFCLRGRLDTACTMLDLLVQYGIEPDEKVYSILLNAAKKELHVPTIQRIMTDVMERGKWNRVILNDILDIIFKHNKHQGARWKTTRKVNNAYRPMLYTYARFFKLEPLQKLTPVPLENHLTGWTPLPKYSTQILAMAGAIAPQPGRAPLQPDSVTLTLMLAAQIRSLRHPLPILRSFRHFMMLVNAQDSLAVGLIQKHGTLVFDIFLMGFAQFRKSMKLAMQLVKNMLHAAEQDERKHGKTVLHPRPSIHTWTILINAFKNHYDSRMSMSIFQMMSQIGQVKPNLTTWNTLIAAFSRGRNARGVVRALNLMEEAGYQPDNFTSKALGYLSRRARALVVKLMERTKKKLEANSDGMEDGDKLDTQAPAVTGDGIKSMQQNPAMTQGAELTYIDFSNVSLDEGPETEAQHASQFWMGTDELADLWLPESHRFIYKTADYQLRDIELHRLSTITGFHMRRLRRLRQQQREAGGLDGDWPIGTMMRPAAVFPVNTEDPVGDMARLSLPPSNSFAIHLDLGFRKVPSKVQEFRRGRQNPDMAVIPKEGLNTSASISDITIKPFYGVK